MKAWDNLLTLVIDDFYRFWELLNKDKPKECKEALLAYAPLLAEKYCNAGCGLVSTYLGKKQKEEGQAFEPVPCSVKFDKEAFKNSIDYFCRRLFGV